MIWAQALEAIRLEPLWGWGLQAQLWALSLWLTVSLGLQALWAAHCVPQAA